MKNITKVVLTLGLLLGLSSLSHAASTDALTVTIRPNAFYSFTLSTGNIGLDLGTVDLAASTQTVRPATVTITSTFLATDMQLSGYISAASNAWSFDNDTTSNEADRIQAWVMLSSASVASMPAQDANYFRGTAPGSNSCVIDGNSRFVGTAGAIANAYEANTVAPAFQEMDRLAPNALAHLWMYFKLPSATTGNAAQNITLVLTASAPVN